MALKSRDDLSETKPAKAEKPKKILRFGLRGRLFLFFFLVPIILIGIEGYLYLQKFNGLANDLSHRSTVIVRQFAEQIIAEKARSVAAQARLYVENHPGLNPEQFDKDPYFKAIMQPVGKTGYTALYTAGDATGAFVTWLHPNPKIIGTDLRSLSVKLPQFWKIMSGGVNGVESSGYYDWEESDGSIKPKFMVCSSVIGTRYYVAATTYLSEFMADIDAMKSNAKQATSQTQNTIITILALILVAIGAITFWYGRSLTSKIRSLTDLTEKISIGDLDAEINVKSNDEIGDLGSAISRMQDSIRISIDRLRRRK